MGGEECFHHRRYLRIGVESASATRAEILPRVRRPARDEISPMPRRLPEPRPKAGFWLKGTSRSSVPCTIKKGRRVLGDIGDRIYSPHLIRVILDRATDGERLRRILRIVDLSVRKTVPIHLEKIRRTKEIAHMKAPQAPKINSRPGVVTHPMISAVAASGEDAEAGGRRRRAANPMQAIAIPAAIQPISP